MDELEAALDAMDGIADDGGELDPENIAREARVRSAYLEWCKEYGKESDESRFAVFSSNFLAMEQYAKESGKEMNLNQYADCTEEEYAAATSQAIPAATVVEEEAVDQEAAAAAAKKAEEDAAAAKKAQAEAAAAKKVADEAAAKAAAEVAASKKAKDEELAKKRAEEEGKWASEIMGRFVPTTHIFMSHRIVVLYITHSFGSDVHERATGCHREGT